PQLVTDHGLLHEHGHVLTAVVHTDGVTDHLRDDGGAPAPRLDHAPVAGGVGGVDLLQQMTVDERPFLHAPRHDSAPLPASNDEAARALALVARLEPLGLLAPRAHGRATAGAPAFPPAVRVVDRVHGTTALVRLAPHPALAAGLADDDVLVLGVADGDEAGVALAMQEAQVAGRHTDGDVGAVAALDLDAGAGRARELRACARHHLDGVHGGADRDEPERHRVACHRLGLGAAHDGAA